MIPMFDFYKERHQLHSTDEIKPGLTAIKFAMDRLGQPQLAVPTIHVAGTNGKGSTIKMLELMLQKHGLTTATFMSPCIEDVHDQIQFNGQPITEQQMDAAFKEAKEKGLENQLTDFELLTAIAFIAIKQKQPAIALIESGLGGRFDSTNVVQPIVSIIPSIALEHTRFLGHTIEEIASHKAGIIKQNKSVVIGKLPKAAEQVMEKEALLQDAKLYCNGKDFSVNDLGEWHNTEGISFSQLQPSLKGEHQLQNMAVAIQAFIIVANECKISIQAPLLQSAVATTSLAGRFENIAYNVWLDGAHNPASAETLKLTVKQIFPNQQVTMVVGILKDKDVTNVLRQLEEVSDDFVFVRVDREQQRLMEPQQLMSLSHATQKQTADSVLEIVQQKSKDNPVIVTGSLYLLAQWRKILLQHLQ
ncbi:MAG: bifunctional folylpolyglutamate synthase/dihydrofolate synthase [Kurthia sp.]|nr:bifunctional folylpolyglutamate synthase/dihydrofolate synthase [Candidatus Kurthia equi]